MKNPGERTPQQTLNLLEKTLLPAQQHERLRGQYLDGWVFEGTIVINVRSENAARQMRSLLVMVGAPEGSRVQVDEGEVRDHLTDEDVGMGGKCPVDGDEGESRQEG